MKIVMAVAGLVAVGATNVQAQSGAEDEREHAVRSEASVSAQLGGWSQGAGVWPHLGLSVDYNLIGALFLEIEAAAVRQTTDICDDASVPACTARNTIGQLGLGFRFGRLDGRIHPYFGAIMGVVSYHERGAYIAANVGARLDVTRSWGILSEAAGELLAEADGLTQGRRLGLGVFMRF